MDSDNAVNTLFSVLELFDLGVIRDRKLKPICGIELGDIADMMIAVFVRIAHFIDNILAPAEVPAITGAIMFFIPSPEIRIIPIFLIMTETSPPILEIDPELGSVLCGIGDLFLKVIKVILINIGVAQIGVIVVSNIVDDIASCVNDLVLVIFVKTSLIGDIGL